MLIAREEGVPSRPLFQIRHDGRRAQGFERTRRLGKPREPHVHGVVEVVAHGQQRDVHLHGFLAADELAPEAGDDALELRDALHREREEARLALVLRLPLGEVDVHHPPDALHEPFPGVELRSTDHREDARERGFPGEGADVQLIGKRRGPVVPRLELLVLLEPGEAIVEPARPLARVHAPGRAEHRGRRPRGTRLEEPVRLVVGVDEDRLELQSRLAHHDAEAKAVRAERHHGAQRGVAVEDVALAVRRPGAEHGLVRSAGLGRTRGRGLASEKATLQERVAVRGPQGLVVLGIRVVSRGVALECLRGGVLGGRRRLVGGRRRLVGGRRRLLRDSLRGSTRRILGRGRDGVRRGIRIGRRGCRDGFRGRGCRDGLRRGRFRRGRLGNRRVDLLRDGLLGEPVLRDGRTAPPGARGCVVPRRDRGRRHPRKVISTDFFSSVLFAVH